MEFNLIPGTPVGQLLQRPRPYGPQQVMSPRASCECPYGGAALPGTPPTPPGFAAPRAPFASLLLIDERINIQSDVEEAQARRLTFEINQGQLYAEREAALRQEVREMQFETLNTISLYTLHNSSTTGNRMRLTKLALTLLRTSAQMPQPGIYSKLRNRLFTTSNAFEKVLHKMSRPTELPSNRKLGFTLRVYSKNCSIT